MTIPKMTIKDLESFTKSHKGLTTLQHLFLGTKNPPFSKDQRTLFSIASFYVFPTIWTGTKRLQYDRCMLLCNALFKGDLRDHIHFLRRAFTLQLN